MGDIIHPHGGFRHLVVYKKSDVIYQGTVVFCRRFLPPYGDRTVDQMIQAARSCKQNIAEGSGRGSLKEQIHFIEIAYGSLLEVYCQLHLALDLNFIQEADFVNAKTKISSISSMLTGLRASLRKRLTP